MFHTFFAFVQQTRNALGFIWIATHRKKTQGALLRAGRISLLAANLLESILRLYVYRSMLGAGIITRHSFF